MIFARMLEARSFEDTVEQDLVRNLSPVSSLPESHMSLNWQRAPQPARLDLYN
jgi:hypothetical protein